MTAKIAKFSPMKFAYSLLLLAAFLTCQSCSTAHEGRTAVRAKHEDSSRDIEAIDEMIVKHKKEFIDKCYNPVLNQESSNNPRPCAVALQQTLERRYPNTGSQAYLDRAADDVFFEGSGSTVEGVNDKIKRIARKLGPSIRAAHFESQQDMLDYYREKYSFVPSEE
jgi:hypothetical protein